MNAHLLRAWLRLRFAVASIAIAASACGANHTQSSAAASPGANGSMPPAPQYAYGQGAPAGAPPAYAPYPPQPYPPQAGGYAPQPYPQAPSPQPGAVPPPSPTPAYGAAPAYAPQGAPPPSPMAPAPSGSSPSQTPPGPFGPIDANSLPAIIQGIQGALQGQMVSPGSLPADLVEAGLKLRAAQVAPGMQSEGSELRQELAEGQHAVTMVTLQAGKCYAIVGFSPPGGVKQLNLNLLAPPLYWTLAGQDLAHGSTPVLGAAPNPMCPVIALPLQYKLDVFARAGSGPVAVQLYSKNK
jgi:hypothetical protein